MGGAAGLLVKTLAEIPAGALAGSRAIAAPPVVLAQPPRNYASLTAKDVFLGLAPSFGESASRPEWLSPRRTTFNSYSSDEKRTEVSLYDVAHSPKFNEQYFSKGRLRCTTGFDTFPFVKDADFLSVAVGVIVRIDLDHREVVLRPELKAQDAPAYSADRAKERKGFFHLDLEKLDKFAKDRTKFKAEETEELARDQAIRAEYGDNVLRVDRNYWETLVKDQVVKAGDDGSFQIELTPEDGGPPGSMPPPAIGGPGGFGGPGGTRGGFGGRGGFGAPGGGRGGFGVPSGGRGSAGGGDAPGGAIDLAGADDFGGPGGFGGMGGMGGTSDNSPLQLLKGKVIRGPGLDWYVKVDEKYCALKLGQSLEDCLRKPLPDARVKELKSAASAAPAAPANTAGAP
jgi:hypothetical protein